MEGLDSDVVRHALTTARRLGFAEVELAMGEDSFSAKLYPGSASSGSDLAHLALDDVPAEPSEPPSRIVAASLVGYYREGFVPLREGAEIRKGDNVAVIVALGIANDVESKWSGRVIEVLASPGQPVQYGQPLAKISVEED